MGLSMRVSGHIQQIHIPGVCGQYWTVCSRKQVKQTRSQTQIKSARRLLPPALTRPTQSDGFEAGVGGSLARHHSAVRDRPTSRLRWAQSGGRLPPPDGSTAAFGTCFSQLPSLLKVDPPPKPPQPRVWPGPLGVGWFGSKSWSWEPWSQRPSSRVPHRIRSVRSLRS